MASGKGHMRGIKYTTPVKITCCDCGECKPETKFYRHMAHCKACHNGLKVWNKQQQDFIQERQLGDPSEEMIRVRCASLQAGWTPKTFERRRYGAARVLSRVAKAIT